MPDRFGKHSLGSAFTRLCDLIRLLGLRKTIGTLVSALDEKFVGSFDRRFHVKTCGYVALDNTGFNPNRLRDATNYSPTSGWGARRMFRELNLSRELRFADLGSGMGRTCIVAAEYGFAHVTGVDLAPELCEIARANIASCRPPSGRLGPLTIKHQDALDFCAETNDDVFFMFRPFSAEFLTQILDRLAGRAAKRGAKLTVIYSERAGLPGDYAPLIARHGAFQKQRELIFFGQAFHIFACDRSPEVKPASTV